MAQHKTFLLSLVLSMGLASAQQIFQCPGPCRCTQYGPAHNLYMVNCSFAGLTQLPDIIPAHTHYLDLSSNHIAYVSDTALDSAMNLSVLDLRNNSEKLTALPTMWHHAHLDVIYIDEGAACCMYETDWKWSDKGEAPADCIATIPYHECDHNLVKVVTLVIYGIVVPVGLICNPWILIVTLCYRPRRRDTITLNSINFSTANILLSVYAAVLFGHGIAYHGDYHHHMYAWLNNPGCGMVGYMLIAATLATSIFYMLEVVLIYQKLRWPLHVERHMSRRRLLLIVAATWAGAFLIGSIPLMTSTKGQYNRVGLCLPFYSGEFDFEFKFVILYTVITNINLVVVIVLTVLLVRSLVKNREEWYGEVPQKVAERNKTLERMLIIALTVYIVINVVLTVFLIMSCVGGKTGKTGREWFSRFAVLEALTNPLVGPIRKRQFHRDTRRLLRRWGLIRWDDPDMSERSSSSFAMRMRAKHGAAADRRTVEVERNESQRKLKAESVAVDSRAVSRVVSQAESHDGHRGEKTQSLLSDTQDGREVERNESLRQLKAEPVAVESRPVSKTQPLIAHVPSVSS